MSNIAEARKITRAKNNQFYSIAVTTYFHIHVDHHVVDVVIVKLFFWI